VLPEETLKRIWVARTFGSTKLVTESEKVI
jgi:hypothetical protein